MQRSKGKDRGRKQAPPRKLRRILILCEDSKSSRDYFACFPHDKSQVEIDCLGTGMNTVSLMKNAIKRADKARLKRAPYERVWVVFDKDDFPEQNFNRAFDLAKNHNEITPCWANECFELWYLLHFHYRDTAIGREELKSLIAKILRESYDKADKKMYYKLGEHLETALKNARRLAYENLQRGTPTRNPSTRIHELVDALIKLDPKKQEIDS